MMTFSFRPARTSVLPSIAASVRTLVVSWNDAADRNESVASEALVIPSSRGWPTGGLLAFCNEFVGNALELVAVHLTTGQKLGIAGFHNNDLAQHLTRDDLDVLVVQVDALGGVDILDVLDEGVHRRLDIGELTQVAEVHEALGDLVTGADGAAVLDTGHEANGCGTRRHRGYGCDRRYRRW